MATKEANTELVFHPGMILGGVFSHDVSTNRCVTYIAEAAVLLLPFAKYDSKITLVGSTQSEEEDLSVDTFRTVTCRWLQLFGVEQCGLRLIRRGSAPGGGGAVDLTCTAVRKLRPVKIVDRGLVKRIRGISFACKTAPDLPQRAATSAKGVLLRLLPDVYIVTDVDAAKGREQCSGYGVMLVAESTSKLAVVSQESIARGRESPEEVGERAAHLLLDQIFDGGCVDAHHQLLVMLLMALSPDDVSVARLGRLTPSAVSAMVLMELYFGVTCAVKEEKQSHGDDATPMTTMLTCIGSNLVNVWKKSS